MDEGPEIRKRNEGIMFTLLMTCSCDFCKKKIQIMHVHAPWPKNCILTFKWRISFSLLYNFLWNQSGEERRKRKKKKGISLHNANYKQKERISFSFLLWISIKKEKNFPGYVSHVYKRKSSTWFYKISSW